MGNRFALFTDAELEAMRPGMGILHERALADPAARSVVIDFNRERARRIRRHRAMRQVSFGARIEH